MPHRDPAGLVVPLPPVAEVEAHGPHCELDAVHRDELRTEETEAPALSSSATVGTLLSDADKRMALLLADDEADAAAGDNLCDVDASRLAQLLAEDREDIGVGTEPSDDPEELQAQMEAMEAELAKLRLIHDMQSQAAELSQLKAALEMEKRQLLMSKQQLDDIEG